MPWICTLVTVLAAANTPTAPAASDQIAESYRAEIQAFRDRRAVRVTGDDGWLTVTGLTWLKEGVHSFGSAPDGAIVFRAGTSPAHAGTLTLANGVVRIDMAPGVRASVVGKPGDNAVTKQILRSDASGPPDIVSLGPLRFFVIQRADRIGLRVRDLETPARKTFAGLRWFPIAPSYRVVGRFVAHAQEKTMAITNVLGFVEKLPSPGVVTFTLGGQTLTLEVLYETPARSELFILFRDRTSGHETYPGGRMLYADLPRDGQVILDFNKAYTPPCAYTRFATCPLPPRGNSLPVRIPAGELNDGVTH